MPELTPDLTKEVKKWWQDAPKTHKGWAKKSVFDKVSSGSNPPKFVQVAMSSGEISARLKVIEDLNEYFGGCSK
jgi:hypothetical protein